MDDSDGRPSEPGEEFCPGNGFWTETFVVRDEKIDIGQRCAGQLNGLGGLDRAILPDPSAVRVRGKMFLFTPSITNCQFR
jgi:hypothetical protein